MHTHAQPRAQPRNLRREALHLRPGALPKVFRSEGTAPRALGQRCHFRPCLLAQEDGRHLEANSRGRDHGPIHTSNVYMDADSTG